MVDRETIIIKLLRINAKQQHMISWLFGCLTEQDEFDSSKFDTDLNVLLEDFQEIERMGALAGMVSNMPWEVKHD
jgi:hypothetical protein